MRDVPTDQQEDSSADVDQHEALKQAGKIPAHIAIIMDGNGRWAQERGEQRVVGHHQGVESVREVVEACAELGVEYLTLYTFSTENWDRPQHEVQALMELLVHTVRQEIPRLEENGIALNAIGDLDALPEKCRDELEKACDLTRDNNRMVLTLALSYSGRWEIVQACRRMAQQAADAVIDPADIDEEAVESMLTTSGMPDPDLLIRTGGEYRLSNFLLWQLAYTEIHTASCFWPEFRTNELHAAIRDFQSRERRYGQLSPGDKPVDEG